MNRRTLLASLAIALTMPTLARAETSSPRCGAAVRTFHHAPHGSLRVTVRRQGGLVAPLPSVDEIMASVIASGHEHAGLEFYIVAQDTISPPSNLDMESIFVTWTGLEGAAAVRRDGGIAVLQDGGTRWTITTAADRDASAQADLLHETALAVSRRRVDAGPDLLALLPTDNELPFGWELTGEEVTPEPCER